MDRTGDFAGRVRIPIKTLTRPQLLTLTPTHNPFPRPHPQPYPTLTLPKVIEAAFGGEIPCKVYRWGLTDLAALIMKLPGGHFAHAA